MLGNGNEQIGSNDKNLTLLTKGKIKIQYGKKSIDLLNHKGELNFPKITILNKVNSLDSIEKEGFYVYNNFLYVYLNSSYINLGEFKSEEVNDWKQKQIDIGLRYNSISEALKSLNNGIVLIDDSLYEIKNKQANQIAALNDNLSQINELENPKEGNIIYFINNEWKYTPYLQTINQIKKRLAVIEKQLNIKDDSEESDSSNETTQ